MDSIDMSLKKFQEMVKDREVGLGHVQRIGHDQVTEQPIS